MNDDQTQSILIVDDDPVLAEGLKNELSRSYFKTSTAGNGAEALDRIGRQMFDIVLLDVQLPDIDGLDLLNQIKEKHRECEVIIMTGFGAEEIAVQALRRGAIDYVEKPLDLEVLRAAVGRAQEKVASKEKVQTRDTLLIVDDDREMVTRMERILTKEGYAVLCAYSGEEAIEVIFKNKIEVVITDIMMADMNGIDLIKRALKTYSNLECIVITGHKDNELAVRALRAGAFDYLTKPIDLEELTISIKRAIEKINLNLTSLYRNRELTISSEIITRMNEELERRIEERSSELAQTQSQLFQTSKLATLGEMAAGLAHEMNQPLAGISLTSRSIRKMKDREKLTDEELISGLDDIELSVKRMARIIEHIRTFARQDAMKFSEVAVNSTIDSALSLMGEQMRLHGIEIQTDYSPSIPKITGEPFQLEQVWINFLANARDALDGIGDREAGFQKQLRISTSLDPEADMLKVMFSDNGPGIPEDVRDKVMEPFFTTKEVGKGMGLGLSISYGIVDSHQGEIALGQSDIGGAEITVLLPLRVEED